MILQHKHVLIAENRAKNKDRKPGGQSNPWKLRHLDHICLRFTHFVVGIEISDHVDRPVNPTKI